MKARKLIIIGIILVAGIMISACSAGDSAVANKIEPAKVEPIDGSEFKRVTLTEKAAERLDIQTGLVREEQISGEQRLVLPYDAVIYGLNGETWVYTNGAPLTYIRAAITVDYIEGDRAVLSEGPPAGTNVVTVGVAELYGTETGVGK
jgi:hypothetical protein